MVPFSYGIYKKIPVFKQQLPCQVANMVGRQHVFSHLSNVFVQFPVVDVCEESETGYLPALSILLFKIGIYLLLSSCRRGRDVGRVGRVVFLLRSVLVPERWHPQKVRCEQCVEQ